MANYVLIPTVYGPIRAQGEYQIKAIIDQLALDEVAGRISPEYADHIAYRLGQDWRNGVRRE